MLHYGVAKAGTSPEPGSVAHSLLVATELGDPQVVGDQILDLVEALFRDAGIGDGRIDHRGNSYSVADAAIQEFIRWHDMPWEA